MGASDILGLIIVGFVVSVFLVAARPMVVENGDMILPGFGGVLWFVLFIVIWVGDIGAMLALGRRAFA